MPSTTAAYIRDSQPAAHERSKPPIDVLAEAELQWIFTEDELLQTPSAADGMAPETEREIRSKGINFITQIGIMLKLPQTTLSTAAVFFNRFLMRHSLVAKEGYKPLHQYQIAATSLFLATKVEEHCRKIKELIVACCRVAQKNSSLLVDEQTKDFWRWRDTILFNEDVLLEMLCFDLTIESPYKLLFDMMKHQNVERNRRLRDAAWSFLNDSNLTQLCLLFTSRAIAGAALYCGAKHCEVGFPDDERGRPWWEIERVTLKEIRRACNYMAGFYEKGPLKPGSESIYVGLRTPEEGDELLAKTRLRVEQTPHSPPPSLSGAPGMERSVSSQSLKRSREEEKVNSNGSDAKAEDAGGGKPDGEPAAKKVKTQSRVPIQVREKEASARNGVDSAGAAKEDDAGSEEGEVEE